MQNLPPIVSLILLGVAVFLIINVLVFKAKLDLSLGPNGFKLSVDSRDKR